MSASSTAASDSGGASPHPTQPQLSPRPPSQAGTERRRQGLPRVRSHALFLDGDDEDAGAEGIIVPKQIRLDDGSPDLQYDTGCHALQGTSSRMEDRVLVVDLSGHPHFVAARRAVLVAVLDGHAGSGAVSYLEAHLAEHLLEEVARQIGVPPVFMPPGTPQSAAGVAHHQQQQKQEACKAGLANGPSQPPQGAQSRGAEELTGVAGPRAGDGKQARRVEPAGEDAADTAPHAPAAEEAPMRAPCATQAARETAVAVPPTGVALPAEGGAGAVKEEEQAAPAWPANGGQHPNGAAAAAAVAAAAGGASRDPDLAPQPFVTRARDDEQQLKGLEALVEPSNGGYSCHGPAAVCNGREVPDCLSGGTLGAPQDTVETEAERDPLQSVELVIRVAQSVTMEGVSLAAADEAKAAKAGTGTEAAAPAGQLVSSHRGPPLPRLRVSEPSGEADGPAGGWAQAAGPGLTHGSVAAANHERSSDPWDPWAAGEDEDSVDGAVLGRDGGYDEVDDIRDGDADEEDDEEGSESEEDGGPPRAPLQHSAAAERRRSSRATYDSGGGCQPPDPPAALRNALLRCERELMEQDCQSGSTALVALMLGDSLWLANVGDCRAVVCDDGEARQLTVDHKAVSGRPGDSLDEAQLGAAVTERQRLLAAGVQLSTDGYLQVTAPDGSCSDIAVSRNLGCAHLKNRQTSGRGSHWQLRPRLLSQQGTASGGLRSASRSSSQSRRNSRSGSRDGRSRSRDGLLPTGAGGSGYVGTPTGVARDGGGAGAGGCEVFGGMDSLGAREAAAAPSPPHLQVAGTAGGMQTSGTSGHGVPWHPNHGTIGVAGGDVEQPLRNGQHQGVFLRHSLPVPLVRTHHHLHPHLHTHHHAHHHQHHHHQHHPSLLDRLCPQTGAPLPGQPQHQPPRGQRGSLLGADPGPEQADGTCAATTEVHGCVLTVTPPPPGLARIATAAAAGTASSGTAVEAAAAVAAGESRGPAAATAAAAAPAAAVSSPAGHYPKPPLPPTGLSPRPPRPPSSGGGGVGSSGSGVYGSPRPQTAVPPHSPPVRRPAMAPGMGSAGNSHAVAADPTPADEGGADGMASSAGERSTPWLCHQTPPALSSVDSGCDDRPCGSPAPTPTTPHESFPGLGLPPLPPSPTLPVPGGPSSAGPTHRQPIPMTSYRWDCSGGGGASAIVAVRAGRARERSPSSPFTSGSNGLGMGLGGSTSRLSPLVEGGSSVEGAMGGCVTGGEEELENDGEGEGGAESGLRSDSSFGGYRSGGDRSVGRSGGAGSDWSAEECGPVGHAAGCSRARGLRRSRDGVEGAGVTVRFALEAEVVGCGAAASAAATVEQPAPLNLDATDVEAGTRGRAPSLPSLPGMGTVPTEAAAAAESFRQQLGLEVDVRSVSACTPVGGAIAAATASETAAAAASPKAATSTAVLRTCATFSSWTMRSAFLHATSAETAVEAGESAAADGPADAAVPAAGGAGSQGDMTPLGAGPEGAWLLGSEGSASGCTSGAAAAVLIPDPDLFHYQISQDSEFLICACDGLWDVMRNGEACRMVRRWLADGRSAAAAAESLCQTALKLGSPDNITVVVLRFSGRPMALAPTRSMLRRVVSEAVL